MAEPWQEIQIKKLSGYNSSSDELDGIGFPTSGHAPYDPKVEMLAEEHAYISQVEIDTKKANKHKLSKIIHNLSKFFTARAPIDVYLPSPPYITFVSSGFKKYSYKYLAEQLSKYRRFVLLGIKDVGKTAIAINFYNNAIKNGGYEKCLWFRADSKSNLMLCYRSLASQLGIASNLTDEKKLKEKVVEYLNDKKWLLVYDGVESAGWLETFLPNNNGEAKVLITSSAKHTGSHDGTTTVEQLNIKHASRFLKEKIQKSSDECKSILESAGKTQYNPREIIIIAEYFLQHKCSVNVIKGILENKSRKEPLIEFLAQLRKKRWRETIEALPNDGSHKLLKIAAFMPPSFLWSTLQELYDDQLISNARGTLINRGLLLQSDIEDDTEIRIDRELQEYILIISIDHIYNEFRRVIDYYLDKIYLMLSSIGSITDEMYNNIINILENRQVQKLITYNLRLSINQDNRNNKNKKIDPLVIKSLFTIYLTAVSAAISRMDFCKAKSILCLAENAFSSLPNEQFCDKYILDCYLIEMQWQLSEIKKGNHLKKHKNILANISRSKSNTFYFFQKSDVISIINLFLGLGYAACDKQDEAITYLASEPNSFIDKLSDVISLQHSVYVRSLKAFIFFYVNDKLEYILKECEWVKAHTKDSKIKMLVELLSVMTEYNLNRFNQEELSGYINKIKKTYFSDWQLFVENSNFMREFVLYADQEKINTTQKTELAGATVIIPAVGNKEGVHTTVSQPKLNPQAVETNSLIIETNNLAIQAFLGNGSKQNPSHLHFRTWYHPDVCHYLLQLVPNQARCIRVIFSDAGYGNNTQTFKDQLQQLVMLGNALQRPAIFISKEPGADNHYICGLIKGSNLLLINPLGITNKTDCYQTIFELKKEGTIGEVWFSSNSLQKREYEEDGLVSCGAVTLELATHVLSQIAADKLEEFWNQLKTNEPTIHEKSGLIYHGMNIKVLLPETLKRLERVGDENTYKTQVCSIRERHLQQLNILPGECAKAEKMTTENYLNKCKGSALTQVVFNMLVTKERTIANIVESQEYEDLKQELDKQSSSSSGFKIQEVNMENDINHKKREAQIDIAPEPKKSKREELHTASNDNEIVDFMDMDQPLLEQQIAPPSIQLSIDGTIKQRLQLLKGKKAKKYASEALKTVEEEMPSINKRLALGKDTISVVLEQIERLRKLLDSKIGFIDDEETSYVCKLEAVGLLTTLINKLLLVKHKLQHGEVKPRIVQVPATQKTLLRTSQGMFIKDKQNSFWSTLKTCLTQIKKLAEKYYNFPNQVFISYAWANEAHSEDKWIEAEFLELLRVHLRKAGIRAELDRVDNPGGGNIYHFMDKVTESDKVVLVGTPTLLEKHQKGTTAICNELILINRKRRENNEAVLPILLAGTFETSFPPYFELYSTIKDWQVDNYITHLKRLIRDIYEIGPDDKEYQKIWIELEELINSQQPKLATLAEKHGIFQSVSAATQFHPEIQQGGLASLDFRKGHSHGQ